MPNTYHVHAKVKDEAGNKLTGVSAQLMLWYPGESPIENRLLAVDSEGEINWSSTINPTPPRWGMSFVKGGYASVVVCGQVDWVMQAGDWVGTVPDQEITMMDTDEAENAVELR